MLVDLQVHGGRVCFVHIEADFEALPLIVDVVLGLPGLAQSIIVNSAAHITNAVKALLPIDEVIVLENGVLVGEHWAGDENRFRLPDVAVGPL